MTQKCQFPGCPDNSIVNIMLPAAKKENDKIIAQQGLGFNVPVCMYHSIILSSERFLLEPNKEKGLAEWHGPVQETMFFEKVLQALVVTGKLQKFMDIQKQKDEDIKKYLKNAAKNKQHKDTNNKAAERGRKGKV